MARKARHTDLQRNIIDFCRVLREREMLVTPSEVIDAIRTADIVDLADRQEFKTALRSVLTARPALGRLLTRIGIGRLPEETAPPRALTALELPAVAAAARVA